MAAVAGAPSDVLAERRIYWATSDGASPSDLWRMNLPGTNVEAWGSSVTTTYFVALAVEAVSDRQLFYAICDDLGSCVLR
ncbi:MAG: hypothetical protein ACREDF_09390, partial [Thermoplasmata archaeon]